MPPTCPLNQNSLTLQRSRMDVKIKQALKTFRGLINRYFSLCVTAYFLISRSLSVFVFPFLQASKEHDKGHHCQTAYHRAVLHGVMLVSDRQARSDT